MVGPKLGILAGAGEFPVRVVEACRLSGREPFVLAFRGHTEPATVDGVEHAWIRLGHGVQGLEALRAAGVEELVMVGPMQRPGLSDLRPDLRTAAFLTKVAAKSLGDDGLLKALIKELEGEGFRVLSLDDVVADLIAREGPYGARRPDGQAGRDIARGIAVARALGAVDVGQSVVVQQGLVLGVEAAEGTDALLTRCKELCRAGPGGVLVKLKKPGQETRVDLPTIGVHTVRGAAAAGLRGIAVEAGGTLVVDHAGVAAAADAAGLFVVGIRPPE